jgi:hypothetical protein
MRLRWSFVSLSSYLHWKAAIPLKRGKKSCKLTYAQSKILARSAGVSTQQIKSCTPYIRTCQCIWITYTSFRNIWFSFFCLFKQIKNSYLCITLYTPALQYFPKKTTPGGVRCWATCSWCHAVWVTFTSEIVNKKVLPTIYVVSLFLFS